jgi:hypothetical protein
MRNQNLGTLFYKYTEPFHDSWEILPVELWQVAVPLLSADFIWTKLSADCCLHGHHKMSKETALHNIFLYRYSRYTLSTVHCSQIGNCNWCSPQISKTCDFKNSKMVSAMYSVSHQLPSSSAHNSNLYVYIVISI